MTTAGRVIWLIRHGNRFDFVHPEWCKTAARPWDCSLSDDGVTQARETGARLARESISHVFSSPFLRAAQTASHIAEAVDRPGKIENGLSEMLLERWFPVRPQFLTASELAAQFSRVDATYVSAVNPVYPEIAEDMLRRTAAVVHAMTERFPGNLVFVGHGGSFTGLAQALTGDGGAIFPALCCLIKIVRRDNAWTLEADGRDRSHLSSTEKELRIC